MSVYNSQRYLREAIDSILNQTFKDFEFIVIDDGSNDKSKAILKSYKDPRMKLITNDCNIGLTRSLNKGLKICCGEYIARMDADDISMSMRIEKQLKFLEKNRKVGVCGCWEKFFNENKEWLSKYPTDSDEIKSNLLFFNVLSHSGTIFRRLMPDGTAVSYNKNYYRSQDYDLWVNLSKVYEIGNIDEILLLCRSHKDSIYYMDNKGQRRVSDLVRIEQLEHLGLSFTNEEIKVHLKICNGEFIASLEFLEEAEKWLLKLDRHNKKHRIYDISKFNKVLSERWYFLCASSTFLGYEVFRLYKNNPSFNNGNSRFRKSAKLIIKSIYRSQ